MLQVGEIVKDGPLRLAAAIGGWERRAGGAGVALVGLRGHCLLALGHAAWPFHKAGHEQESGSTELSEVPGGRERVSESDPGGPWGVSN